MTPRERWIITALLCCYAVVLLFCLGSALGVFT